jgi:hypothetical protein
MLQVMTFIGMIIIAHFTKIFSLSHKVPLFHCSLFGVVVGNTTHELHELADPGRSGGGGVRDGGFAFAFGDAASRGEDASKTSFLRTVGQVEGYLKEQAGLIEK